MQDVTTRRVGEGHRAVVEQSSHVIHLVDVGGVIQYVSPAARPVLGYEPGDLVGRVARTLLDAPEGREVLSRALGSELGERGTPVEVPIGRRDGSIAHVEVRYSNLLGLEPVQ